MFDKGKFGALGLTDPCEVFIDYLIGTGRMFTAETSGCDPNLERYGTSPSRGERCNSEDLIRARKSASQRGSISSSSRPLTFELGSGIEERLPLVMYASSFGDRSAEV